MGPNVGTPPCNTDNNVIRRRINFKLTVKGCAPWFLWRSHCLGVPYWAQEAQLARSLTKAHGHMGPHVSFRVSPSSSLLSAIHCAAESTRGSSSFKCLFLFEIRTLLRAGLRYNKRVQLMPSHAKANERNAPPPNMHRWIFQTFSMWSKLHAQPTKSTHWLKVSLVLSPVFLGIIVLQLYVARFQCFLYWHCPSVSSIRFMGCEQGLLGRLQSFAFI